MSNFLLIFGVACLIGAYLINRSMKKEDRKNIELYRAQLKKWE